MTRLPGITPDWPAPRNVRAFSTTRAGGVSRGAYESLNLGNHVGDDPEKVNANRRRLCGGLRLPAMPHWLTQVHGVSTIDLATMQGSPRADASWTATRGLVCAVLTADCLPILLCDTRGKAVAAIHAGWRGLAAGVIRSAVEALPAARANLLAWLGPAISQAAFEVGSEVRSAFVDRHPEAAHAFAAAPAAGKYHADLYALARQELGRLGVNAVFGGGECTHGDRARFFSYRRDGECGRMATVIWLD